MRYEIRPLGKWIDPETSDRASSRRFRAPWSNTLELLGKETELLGAELVVIQLDVQEGEIRRDGMLYSRAKVGHPGVAVSFDSKHGPLRYATDAYDEIYYGDPPAWQANVRAIALALEALRAVDRYGVTKRGEQYTGWKALPSGAAAPEPKMSVDQAAQYLADKAGIPEASLEFVSRNLTNIYRHAAKRHHPDAGGDPDVFRRVTEARDLLGARP